MKSHRAKGKRVTTLDVTKLTFIDPLDKAPLKAEEQTNEEDEVDELNDVGSVIGAELAQEEESDTQQMELF